MSAAVTVEVDGLSHRYGHRVGLEPVSFTAQSPGVVAIQGVNGSGKSTLLRILAGLLRHHQGRVTFRVDGAEVQPGERPRWVGYAAPDLAFYPELSAGENLGFAAETRGLDRPREKAREALARVGLASREHERAAALSSGMVQRLRLAFALLHRPPVLLLDEPGSHLDDPGRDALAELIGRERSECLVVIATNEEREWTLADQRVELAGRGLGDPA